MPSLLVVLIIIFSCFVFARSIVELFLLKWRNWKLIFVLIFSLVVFFSSISWFVIANDYAEKNREITELTVHNSSYYQYLIVEGNEINLTERLGMILSPDLHSVELTEYPDYIYGITGLRNDVITVKDRQTGRIFAFLE